MSALDEKLEPVAPSLSGLALAPLSALLKRWRAAGVDGSSIDASKPPALVLVATMRRETWRMVGRADGARTMYELIETIEPKQEQTT